MLHKLAKALKENNFQMTPGMVEEFEGYLSMVAEGSRILHPVFGLGTVKSASNDKWIKVNFDKDVEKWELEQQELQKEIEKYRNAGHPIPWSLSNKRGRSKPSRTVMISSCHSIHMMLKKEMQKDIFGK
jgi:hypothetical protein